MVSYADPKNLRQVGDIVELPSRDPLAANPVGSLDRRGELELAVGRRPGRLVDVEAHPGGRLAVLEVPQRRRLRPAGEPALARPEHDGVGEDPVLVDEAVAHQRLRQPRAAVDLQLPPRSLLERRDRGRDVPLDQPRGVPRHLAQRARRDMLGQPVEPARDRVVGIGHPRPRRGEDLVGAAAEQERVGVLDPAGDRRAHVVVEVGHEPAAVREAVARSSWGPPGARAIPSSVVNICSVSRMGLLLSSVACYTDDTRGRD